MNEKSADTSWMAGSVGVSSHWTADTLRRDGSRPVYADAVAAFDATAYADALASAGATHCIFTLAHARQFLPMPLPELDRILPGRTAARDLVGDLIEALSTRGIRFIAYYNHSCNGDDDPAWKKACGYAVGCAGNLDHFADNICSIVAAISRQYGDGISGWWFDSGYSVDPRGPHNTITCDMGAWRFPWDALADAAQSGNPRAALAFNAGVGENFAYTDRSDYYAGEAVELDEPFAPPPLPDKQDHRWICLDSPNWVFSKVTPGSGFEVPPRFPDDAIAAYVREHVAAGRMVTFNILIDALGRINPAPLAQLRRCIDAKLRPTQS